MINQITASFRLHVQPPTSSKDRTFAKMIRVILQLIFLVERRKLLFFFAIFTITFEQPARGSAQKRLDKSCENGVCYREEDRGPCTPNNDEPRLYRWEPIKVHMLAEFISAFHWL